MKIFNSKIYKDKQKIFIEANYDYANIIKSFFKKDDEWLVDFAFEIAAYNFLFTNAARVLYLRKTRLSNNTYSNIRDFVTKEEIIDKDIIELQRIKISKAFTSTIKDERFNQRIKKILLNRRLTLLNQASLNENGALFSLEDDFKKDFLPSHKKERTYIVKKIFKKYSFEKIKIETVPTKIFKIILHIVNDDDISFKEVDTIKFLERFIIFYYPNFVNDLELKITCPQIADLRKDNKSKTKFNCVCHFCGKLLNKITNFIFCTKGENRLCYELRLKNSKGVLTSKEKKIMSARARAKNICDNCKCPISLSYVSKIAGVSYQFCSNRCKETFRKRLLRANK